MMKTMGIVNDDDDGVASSRPQRIDSELCGDTRSDWKRTAASGGATKVPGRRMAKDNAVVDIKCAQTNQR